jgi:hypothetical protein
MKKVECNVSFFGLLGLLFIGLKLGGIIGWSWWWVLAPLWGPVAIAATIIAVGLTCYFWGKRYDL